MIKLKELEKYILLQKNIITKIVSHNLLILIKILFCIIFLLYILFIL